MVDADTGLSPDLHRPDSKTQAEIHLFSQELWGFLTVVVVVVVRTLVY